MFEAKLQGEVLKKVQEALNEIVSYASWSCSPQGLTLQALDDCHVCLVELLLTADGFDKFICERDLVLGVNMNHFSALLSCCNNKDTITLKADDSDTLKMIFKSPDGNKVSTYELALMDIEDNQLQIPDCDYKCKVTLPSSEFSRICRNLKQLSDDTVTINFSQDGVEFIAEGLIGKGSIKLTPNSNSERPISLDVTEPIHSDFTMRYLSRFSKASTLSPTIVMSFSDDTPLVVEYPIKDWGFVKYFLAPKVTDSE